MKKVGTIFKAIHSNKVIAVILGKNRFSYFMSNDEIRFCDYYRFHKESNLMRQLSEYERMKL